MNRTMRKLIRLLPTLGLVVPLATCTDETTAPQLLSRNHSVADAGAQRFLVAFRANRVPADFAAAVARLGGSVEALLDPVGGAVVSDLSPEAVATLTRRGAVLALNRDGAFPLRTRPRAPIPLPPAGTEITSVAAPQTAILFSWQWNLPAVNVPAAWAAGRLGSASVTAAILDTGLDPLSLDQGSRIDLGTSVSFVPADDAIVQALFPGHPVIADLDGHGTNVGTQVSSSAVAFAGVTSRTRLMGVKVCSWATGGCPFSAIIQGFIHAVDNGADVINMSLGGSFSKRQNGAFLSLLNRILQYAEQNGVTVVVSAGNSGENLDRNRDSYHAFCDAAHVICVAATGATTTGPQNTGPFGDVDQSAHYTNFGRSRVDVAAPGGDYILDEEDKLVSAGWIWSLCTRYQTERDENDEPQKGICTTGNFITGYVGTSQAAPHVAGLAALLVGEVGRNPSLIRELIKDFADDLGSAGTDPYYGKGRINVAATHW